MNIKMYVDFRKGSYVNLFKTNIYDESEIRNQDELIDYALERLRT